MLGPKPIFASGRSRRTAVARRCAAEWRSTSSAVASFSVSTRKAPLARSGVTRSWIVAIHRHGDRRAQQSGADARDDVARQRAVRDTTDGTVGERQGQLGVRSIDHLGEVREGATPSALGHKLSFGHPARHRTRMTRYRDDSDSSGRLIAAAVGAVAGLALGRARRPEARRLRGDQGADPLALRHRGPLRRRTRTSTSTPSASSRGTPSPTNRSDEDSEDELEPTTEDDAEAADLEERVLAGLHRRSRSSASAPWTSAPSNLR